MSYKHEIQANSFRSNDGTDIVTRDGKQAYDQVYHVDDFTNDHLINKRATAEMIANGIVSYEAVLVATGTVINSDGFVVISYSAYTAHGTLPDMEWWRIESTYKARFYPEIRQYPATGLPTDIWVYASDIDDGTGHTNHDYQLVLR